MAFKQFKIVSDIFDSAQSSVLNYFLQVTQQKCVDK